MAENGPRTGLFGGEHYEPSYWPDGTWLEAEEILTLASPKSTPTRRAKARCPDGRLRVVACGLADSLFTIPAQALLQGDLVAGRLAIEEGGLRFELAEDETHWV